MKTKTISSTKAQNNFGQILDDVVQNNTRYFVQRRNVSQAVLINLADFEALLIAGEDKRKELGRILREQRPSYAIGNTISE